MLISFANFGLRISDLKSFKKSNIHILEHVQRKFTKHLYSLKGLSYTDRLQYLSADSLEHRCWKADMIITYKYLHSLMDCSFKELGLQVCNNHTKGRSLKLVPPLAHHAQSKQFFKYRILEQWNMLSHMTLTTTSLRSFKANL